MKPLKVIVATSIYPPEIDRLATYSKEIAMELSNLGHQIRVVAQASTAEALDDASLIVVSKNKRLPFRLMLYTYALWKHSKGADVIYAQNAVAAGLPAVLVGAVRRMPVVVNFFEDETRKRSHGIRLIKTIQRFVLHRATRVVVESQEFKKILGTRYDLTLSKIIVCPPALEKPPVLPFSPSRKPHQIVMLGNSVAHSIEMTLQATALLVKEFPDTELLIVGEGAAQDHVTFLGRASRAEVWYRLQESAVLVLLNTEAFSPAPILYALCAGAHVVASDLPAYHEHNASNAEVTYVASHEPTDLVASIRKVFMGEFRPGPSNTPDQAWATHIEQLQKVLYE